MKYLKMLGIAAVAAMAFTAFAASTASATTLEINGVTQNGPVTIDASLASGTSAVLSRTDGSLANTCTTSTAHGTTTVYTGTYVEGPLTGHGEGTSAGLTFGSCTRPVTVHDPGTLAIDYDGDTSGEVLSKKAEVTVSTPFGTVNCKTGEGTKIGTLTGATSISNPGVHAIMHINAVLNCGFLLPSASWKGTYTITTPTDLGVSA